MMPLISVICYYTYTSFEQYATGVFRETLPVGKSVDIRTILRYKGKIPTIARLSLI